MDNTEIHYITYDPEEIIREMLLSYIEHGGDVLYPGDEKEILLHTMQGVMVQAFAGIDNALRMGTLRYAVGEYLDLIGETRGCTRLEATAAMCPAEITFLATGTPGNISAGTQVTADGDRLYSFLEDVYYSGNAGTADVILVAEETGASGNGLTYGTQMQFLITQYAVESLITTSNASGGQNREEDEPYRERIRMHGLASVTTGPKEQYEAAAKDVSSEILDARAVSNIAGNVEVAILTSRSTSSPELVDAVEAALNDKSVRPLTDNVTVYEADTNTYTLIVQYAAEQGDNIEEKIASAAAAYKEWQDNTIGRAWNPDRLMAMVYQAGAVRVVWGEESKFGEDGPVEYTEIDPTAHCKGSITIEVLP